MAAWRTSDNGPGQTSVDLYNGQGHRKYLTANEWAAFLKAAEDVPRTVRTLCIVLAYSGCRISEALALTADRVDLSDEVIIIQTLKKRASGIYRAVPLPGDVFETLDLVHGIRDAQRARDGGAKQRLWPFTRMTGWRHVKDVMLTCGVRGPHATPKGLRHGFGVAAVTAGVPLNLVQKWLGHAQVQKTAIYADAMGAEAQELARKMWAGGV